MAGEGNCIRVRKIDAMDGLLAEMCHVYRMTRRSEVSQNEGLTLMRMLKMIVDAATATEIESRLRVLEDGVQDAVPGDRPASNAGVWQ